MRIADVFGSRAGDNLFVTPDRIGLEGRNKGRADISKIGAQHPRRADRPAVADGARQRDRAIEPLPGLGHECEWRYFAAMAPYPSAHQTTPVPALLSRLLRNFLFDHSLQ